MKRRDFLKTTGFLGVSAASFGLAACSDDSQPEGDEHKFPQGVAAADPRPDSIVLWTRAVPKSADDIASAAAADIQVRLAVTASDNSRLLGQTTALAGEHIATAALTAESRYDHTIRHKLTGLKPGQVYYYQFNVGGSRSRIGRFRTAAATGTEIASLRFAVLVCQDWSVNHWAAFDHLVATESDLDFFLHLGDYIYETVGKDFQSGAVESAHGKLIFPHGTENGDGSTFAASIDDYRYLYKRYRSDPRLQSVHERYAMIAVWDDHEFSDDCWGDAETYTNGTYGGSPGKGDNQHQTERRRGANQAWFEYMPADVIFDAAAPGFETIRIYRDFQFGSLAHLLMTDQRLYRADHMIPEASSSPLTGSEIGSVGSRYMVTETALYANAEAARIAEGTAMGDPLALVSMLGAKQREWWKRRMLEVPSSWKLWGSELMLLKQGLDGLDAFAVLLAREAVKSGAAAGFEAIRQDIRRIGIESRHIPAERKAALAPLLLKFVLNADGWDGYDAERRDLMRHLKEHGITNVVALTGDIHAFYAGEVRDDYRAADGGTAVMSELVFAGVSSDSFFSYLKTAVGSLSEELAPLVYHPVRNFPVPEVGEISFDLNLLDFTLGKSSPSLQSLQEQARHPVRAALAALDIPEQGLDSATDAALAALAGDPAFSTDLLALAQKLAGLHSNPWLRHVDTDAQGYGVVTVTREQVQCEMRKVHRLVGGRAPIAPAIAASTTATIGSGSPMVTIG